MVEIKLKLQRGDVFNGEIEINQTIIQDISNQVFETNQTSLSTMQFIIKDNRSRNLKIDATYENIFVHLKNPLINIKYDSQSKNNAIELDIIKNIINKKISILVNENGEISIEGINPILNSIIRNNALNPVATATVISFFNEKQIKNTLIYLFNYQSRKKEKAGSTWSGFQSITLDNVQFKTNNKWKLQKINDDTLLLDLKAKITGKKIQGEQKGQIEIDRKTSWVSTANIEQNIPVGTEPGAIGLKSTINFNFKKAEK